MINVEECRSQRLSNTGNSTGYCEKRAKTVFNNFRTQFRNTQLTYSLLITVHPVRHLYIESEVVILFDDVRSVVLQHDFYAYERAQSSSKVPAYVTTD